MWVITRLDFTEYRYQFDSIRLFSHILFILRLQFSTWGLAPDVSQAFDFSDRMALVSYAYFSSLLLLFLFLFKISFSSKTAFSLKLTLILPHWYLTPSGSP